MLFADKQSVFLVGQLTQNQFDSIVFGDEGQGYQLMNVEEFLSSSQVVPQLQERLRDYLEEVKMIFAIATTTLNKEVKRKLETGQYSREEAIFIYIEYLKLKKMRERAMKEHYTDVIEEFKKNKENTKWKHGKS